MFSRNEGSTSVVHLSREDTQYFAEEVRRASEQLPEDIMWKRLRHPNVQRNIRLLLERNAGRLPLTVENLMDKLNSRIEKHSNVSNISWDIAERNSHFVYQTETPLMGMLDASKKSRIKALQNAHEKHHAVFFPVFGINRKLPGLLKDVSEEITSGMKLFGREIIHDIKAQRPLAAMIITYVLYQAVGSAAFLLLPVAIYNNRKMYFYLKSAYEVYARFAQIKDYFGIVDDSPITRKHWEYAKQNYVKDTGVDNNMKDFFRLLPDEKVDAFLEIMNKHGV